MKVYQENKKSVNGRLKSLIVSFCMKKPVTVLWGYQCRWV
jgi:hypothetical protein